MKHDRRSFLAFLALASVPSVSSGGDIPVQRASWGTVPLSKAEWPQNQRRAELVRVLGYPVHSVSWHITGSAETHADLVNHMLTSSHHGDVRRTYSASELQSMSRQELMSMHDDSHNHRLRDVHSKVDWINPKYPADIGDYPTRRTVSAASGCPGGVCPSGISRSSGNGTRITTKTRTNFFTGLNFF